MNIKQTREFINNTALTGSILGMESIVHLCKRLDNPQDKIKTIHIAGTNGKGSTGILLQNVLMALGYRVGRYSSPAVFSYEEMFQLNGKNISEERLAKVFTTVKNACDRMVDEGMPHPTIFEVETGAAFTFFAEEECDFGIIEVGMGGRTDATNVISQPTVSVITSISMDHMAFLGDTVEKIAYMKAGIIKKGCPVVSLWQKDSVRKVLEDEALWCETSIVYAKPGETQVLEMTPDGMKLSVIGGEVIETKITGLVQVENITCVRKILEVLSRQKEIDLNSEEQQGKMLQGFKDTIWRGRFETIASEPRVIIDGAHNQDAAEKLAQTIQTFFPTQTIRFVVGVLRDKDYPEMMKRVLPLGVEAFCVTPANARGLNAEELAKVAAKVMGEKAVLSETGLDAGGDATGMKSCARVHVCTNPQEAVEQAIACSKPEDVVIAFGSLSYLAEVRNEVCKD